MECERLIDQMLELEPSVYPSGGTETLSHCPLTIFAGAAEMEICPAGSELACASGL